MNLTQFSVRQDNTVLLNLYGNLCTEAHNITKPIDGNYPDVPYYVHHLFQISDRILETLVGIGRLLIPLRSLHSRLLLNIGVSSFAR
jgi:hypothetical protein